MKVRFKRGWWRTHGTLTPGNVYRVVGIEYRWLRIIDDEGSPCLFSPEAFVVVDSTIPTDWRTTRDADGEVHSAPAELSEPHLYERWHDSDRDACAKLSAYVNRVCWAEARAADDLPNTYLRIRKPGEPVITTYVELDEERLVVRRIEVLADGRVSCNDPRDPDGPAPMPTLDELTADPRCEQVSVARGEFEALYDEFAYPDCPRE